MPLRRISREEMLMTMADVVAKRSTCNRLNVGAVFVRDFRVISQGYNGAASGLDHCNHRLDDEQPCTDAVHAEANGIAFAARHGVALDFAEVYVTHSPCVGCARLLVNAGISRVVFQTQFRDTTGLELLEKAGVQWAPFSC